MSILQNKIDEIRRKPEHIRIRYAWVYTAIVMFFVILIWIASFNSGEEETLQSNTAIVQPDVLDQFQEGKKSLQDTTDQMKGTFQGLGQQMPQGQNSNSSGNGSVSGATDNVDTFPDDSEGFGQ
jgi:hypothetical protein